MKVVPVSQIVVFCIACWTSCSTRGTGAVIRLSEGGISRYLFLLVGLDLYGAKGNERVLARDRDRFFERPAHGQDQIP